jgi:hypothetical protein
MYCFSLGRRKHHTKPNLGTLYKIPGQYSYFFPTVLEVELRASAGVLPFEPLYQAFCSGYLTDRISLYVQTTILFVLPHIAGMTGMPHHIQPLVEMGSHKCFAGAGLEL